MLTPFTGPSGQEWEDELDQFLAGIEYNPLSIQVLEQETMQDGSTKWRVQQSFKGDDSATEMRSWLSDGLAPSGSPKQIRIWIKSFPANDYKGGLDGHSARTKRFTWTCEPPHPIEMPDTSALQGSALTPDLNDPESPNAQIIKAVGAMWAPLLGQFNSIFQTVVSAQAANDRIRQQLVKDHQDLMRWMKDAITSGANQEMEALRMLKEMKEKEMEHDGAMELERVNSRNNALASAVVRLAGPILEKNPDLAADVVAQAAPHLGSILGAMGVEED